MTTTTMIAFASPDALRHTCATELLRLVKDGVEDRPWVVLVGAGAGTRRGDRAGRGQRTTRAGCDPHRCDERALV